MIYDCKIAVIFTSYCKPIHGNSVVTIVWVQDVMVISCHGEVETYLVNTDLQILYGFRMLVISCYGEVETY